ncbi:Pre-mRNA-splicing factor [Apophysomyces ossiformis]|uniref:Pre-mRNA-splicing factor n=1 Tax=Apophysomyces ossiformis TaxID=679940 RepID=A0A8H7ER95_9FUNG|nr:Pre-mRNA-splicing factor [Apophysomyces ossiformis]
MAPARKQVDQATIDEHFRERRPEGGAYNIWHHRYQGLERDWSKKGSSVRAKFRCNVARDSGDTAGSGNSHAYFCLYFAKGMCSRGSRCAMWHRIPTDKDEVETTIDCFGRDKFMEFRQDMGGVGSFNTQNRTLYVGRIAVTENLPDVTTIVRTLRQRGVAFVTYTSRSNAEFAREAMMNQSLDNNEIINVRWATQEQSTATSVDDEEVEEVPLRPEAPKGDETEPEVGSFDQQDIEADLPAEYTQLKRDMDEDGFHEMEMRHKRQKAEEAQRQPEPVYDPESAMAIYGYTQPAQEWMQAWMPPSTESLPRAALPQSTAPKKAGGIIPQNVLASLKTLSKGAKDDAAKKETVENKGGLGGLADYGSDSEDDE